MAITGSVQGNVVGLYIDDSNANSDGSDFITSGTPDVINTTDYHLIGASTNASISISNASYETVFKTTNGGSEGIGSSARSYGIGSQSASMSLEGVVAMDATYNLEFLAGLAIDKTKVTVVWATNDASEYALAGSGFVTSLEASAGVNDFTTFSCTIEIDGDVSEINAA
jgi:hypothetical protein